MFIYKYDIRILKLDVYKRQLMDLFGRNDCDTEDTIEAFDEKVLDQILEPEEAHYLSLIHI